MKEQWVWFYAISEDAEGWYHAASREGAIAKGRELFNGDAFVILEGRRATLRDDIFDADHVIDQFEEKNEECWGEDGPTGETNADIKAELEAVLTAAFAAWRSKHNPWTSWACDKTRNVEHIAP